MLGRSLKNNTMKTILYTILYTLFIVSSANADTYGYPDKKRPAVSLDQACKIAQIMLSSKNDEKRFYITEVSLLGNDKQDGSGGWNLWHYDEKGNKVNAHISFPTGVCTLYYYPHDRMKNGGDKKIVFDTATNLLKKHIKKANKSQ
jgi:hypothetical protein